MTTFVEVIIDSKSVGDPARHKSFDELERELESLGTSPADAGRLALIVRRGDGGRREVLDQVYLSVDGGVTGDAWSRKDDRHLDAQIAVMQANVAELIANGQPLTLFGDSLFLDLDLSRLNLPVGSRVRLGHATLEVTPMPHNGCRKFQARFGPDALRFVSNKGLRHRNLRGIYMRVVEAGLVSAGDVVEVKFRERQD